MVETDTVGASRPKLAEYGLGEQIFEVNRAAACIVGGCCGTTPEHVRQVVQAVREAQGPKAPPPRVALLSSGIKAQHSSQATDHDEVDAVPGQDLDQLAEGE